eukprot:scaffold22.g6126.t1
MSEDPGSDQAQEPVNITADGKVSKRILKQGDGECPSKHARCLVHYVGRLAESGDVFMDSKDESRSNEPVTVVAGRDTVAREVGLNLAVSTMRPGEVAEVSVAPEYGFGERGNFSFPTVELVGFEAADDEKEPRHMLFEERLEAAERRRQDGNALFRDGMEEEALAKYRHALTYIDEDLMIQLQGPHLDKAIAVRLPILLNMAACSLKAGDYHTAVAHCTEVLREQPTNAKALFRRGRARLLLGQTEAALADLEKAAALEPQDKAISKDLQAARAEQRKERAAESQLFKGYFGKAKDSLYDEGEAPSDEGKGSHGGALAWRPRGGGGSQLSALSAPLAWLHALFVTLRAGLAALFPAFVSRGEPAAALHPTG